jgi:hypothetical protein
MSGDQPDIAREASEAALGAVQVNGRIVESMIGILISNDANGARSWHILHIDGQSSITNLGLVNLLDQAIREEAYAHYFNVPRENE